jgi:hypothetical protein
MKNVRNLIILAAIVLIGGFFLLATENLSNGERIGTVTQFSLSGRYCKSHEGHLNVTQTGMNSSTGFDFSVDRDNEPAGVVALLDSAANNGWKVKVVYHEVRGYNWFHNRGNTNHFITQVIVLDRHFDDPFGNKNGNTNANSNNNTGRVIDTIYIVITPSDKNYSKFFKTKNDTI